MPRKVAVLVPKFAVVQHPGQGLLVFPARSFANVAAAAGKLQGAKREPDVSLMTRAQIDSVLAGQRAELAAEDEARALKHPTAYQLQKERRKPTAAVKSERRVHLLSVIAGSEDGVGMVELRNRLGVKSGTIRSQLVALEDAGLISLSRMPRKGAGGQPQIFSRVTQKGRDQLVGRL